MSAVLVVGAGYVGLPTAACLAHLGHHVVCCDVDEAKIAELRRGAVQVLEEGLPALVAEGLEHGRLTFEVGATVDPTRAEFVFLCLPTPEGPDGAADLSVVEDTVQAIAPSLRSDAVVVTKSTMPVGSTARVAQLLAAAGAPEGVRVVANPEFLREGHAVEEFLHPHRIVIGADDETVAARVADLYGAIDAPVLRTDPASAELIKYASNAFLATKISFVNELANACDVLGADIVEVVRGIGQDPRIGFGWLGVGPGWGGPCLPKDTTALLRSTGDAGYEFELVRCAVEVNQRQRERVVEKVEAATGGALASAVIAVWGLTFKAGTDDLRQSPAVDVARLLAAKGATVRAFDPAARGHAGVDLGGVDTVADPIAACAGADVLVVLTEWEEFRKVDLAKVGTQMKHRRIVDARNVLDPDEARAAGFDYRGAGR
jgi:UDPglucose 6-dehydrogenase